MSEEPGHAAKLNLQIEEDVQNVFTLEGVPEFMSTAKNPSLKHWQDSKISMSKEATFGICNGPGFRESGSWGVKIVTYQREICTPPEPEPCPEESFLWLRGHGCFSIYVVCTVVSWI